MILGGDRPLDDALLRSILESASRPGTLRTARVPPRKNLDAAEGDPPARSRTRTGRRRRRRSSSGSIRGPPGTTCASTGSPRRNHGRKARVEGGGVEAARPPDRRNRQPGMGQRALLGWSRPGAREGRRRPPRHADPEQGRDPARGSRGRGVHRDRHGGRRGADLQGGRGPARRIRQGLDRRDRDGDARLPSSSARCGSGSARGSPAASSTSCIG